MDTSCCRKSIERCLVGRTGLIVKVKPKAADNVKLSTPYSSTMIMSFFTHAYWEHAFFCVNGH